MANVSLGISYREEYPRAEPSSKKTASNNASESIIATTPPPFFTERKEMITPRRSPFLFLLMFAVVALLLPTKPSSADGTPAPPPLLAATNTLAGRFRYAGTANEEIGRKVAIDKAIDSLFFAIRPIARSRLSNGTKIDPSVTFTFEPGKIRVKVPSAPEAISPDNGSAVEFVSDGEKSKLTQKQTPGPKLTQVFQAEEGRRQNDWQLSADGATLTLRVTISSPKLSNPLIYTLTYKRA